MKFVEIYLFVSLPDKKEVQAFSRCQVHGAGNRLGSSTQSQKKKKKKKRKNPVGGDKLIIAAYFIIIDIVTGCMLSNEPKCKIPKADAKCRK